MIRLEVRLASLFLPRLCFAAFVSKRCRFADLDTPFLYRLLSSYVSSSTHSVIAIWSIIFCRCVGLISSDEVLSAHLASSSADEDLTPREALELVKERIEGEAVTPTWCSVDTRIGGLTVHLEEGRCFEAEIHMDELGEELKGGFKEDQRGECPSLLYACLHTT